MPNSGIYLFYGTENYLIEEQIKKLINLLIPIDERDLNVSTFDLLTTPLEEVMEEAETLPFLSAHKVIIAKNAYLFTGQKVSKSVDHQINTLELFLDRPAEYSTIVFWVPGEKLDERKKIVKIIKQKGIVKSFSFLTGSHLTDWLKKSAKYNMATITDEAAEQLVHIVGHNLQLLSQEINKMAVYVGAGGLIDKQVVTELSARTMEQNIFTLIEAAANLEIEKAFQIFYDLLKNKEEPVKMVALFARQFRLMLYAKELSRVGYSNQQIAQQLGVHPFVIQLAGKQSQRFNEEQLQDVLKKLTEIDYEIKTGRKDKILSLEMFMFYLQDLVKQKTGNKQI